MIKLVFGVFGMLQVLLNAGTLLAWLSGESHVYWWTGIAYGGAIWIVVMIFAAIVVLTTS